MSILTAQERKERPLARGVLDYFPDALMEVAHVSFVGNEQHNPGQPLHWAKEKSTDEADCILRHLSQRGTIDTDGLRHSAKVAWRALALLQRELDAAAMTHISPHRATGLESSCENRKTTNPSWECERELGHSGDHMAWDNFDLGRLFNDGQWS